MKSKACFFLMLLFALCSAGMEWSFITNGPSPIETKPVIIGSTAVTASLDGTVYGVNVGDGRLIWSYASGSPVEADPVIAGSNIVFGNADGHIVALNPSNGESAWKFNTGRVYGLLGSKTVLYATTLGNILALDASTGTPLWNFSTYSNESSRTATAPGSSNTAIFVGANDKLISLDASSGAQLWNTTIGRVWKGSPLYSLTTNTVYIGTTDNSLYALDASTGKVKWTFTTDGWITSTPLFYNNILYFGSNDMSMYAVNALTGALLWKFKTEEAIQSQPSYYGQNIIFGSNDHNLYALNMNSGEEIWSFEAGDWAGSPVSYQNRVLFGSRDGSLYDISVITMCSIDKPSSGAVAGNIPLQISGRAYAEDGVKKVQLQLNKGGWGDAIGTEEWNYSYDPSTLPNGAVEIDCRITDNAGSMESAPYTYITIVKDSSKLASMTVNCPTSVDAGKKFTVNVSDEDGNPLSDIEATLDGATKFKGDNGTVEVEIDKGGSHTLSISRDGYETAKITITAKETGITTTMIAVLVLIFAAAVYFFMRERHR